MRPDVPEVFGRATTGDAAGSGAATTGAGAGGGSTGLARWDTADFLAEAAGVAGVAGWLTAGWRLLVLTAATRLEAAVSSWTTAATRDEVPVEGLRPDAEEAATGLFFADCELAGFDGLVAFDADGLVGMSRCFAGNVNRPPRALGALVGRIIICGRRCAHPWSRRVVPLRNWVKDAPWPCR